MCYLTESEENRDLRTQLLEARAQLDDNSSELVEELRLNISELNEKCKKLQDECDRVSVTFLCCFIQIRIICS